MEREEIMQEEKERLEELSENYNISYEVLFSFGAEFGVDELEILLEDTYGA